MKLNTYVVTVTHRFIRQARDPQEVADQACAEIPPGPSPEQVSVTVSDDKGNVLLPKPYKKVL